MSQVITNAFEQYWQSSLAAEQPVVLDEFVLADIPNLDITAPIDPDTGLPPQSQIVHRQTVDQRGRVNSNAVAYSIVMDTTVGDFSFNAMFLRNKTNGVIGMIVYKGRETKLKTDQTTGQTGNSLVKSMLMGYDQAAEATLTHVDAGTWQIDYAARLRGQDEDLRQLASQLYGHHTFIGDGFKVVQQDGSHQVTPGVAIVGGLLVELKQPEVIYPGSKPIGVWVDVHRAGSLLSEHQNHFTIITSVADLTDHVDGSGYQHYVAKLATVQADSTVIDGRGQGGSGGSGAIPDTFALWRRSMAEAGYDLIGQFGQALNIDKEKQVILYRMTDEIFEWTGQLPKEVGRNINPLLDSTWVKRTKNSLRDELSSQGGAGAIGGLPVFVTAIKYAGGATTLSNENDVAITEAISDAIATGNFLYWPQVYEVQGTIKDLHKVRHMGPGGIRRGNDTLYVDKEDIIGKLYASVGGSVNGDGITDNHPMTLDEALIAAQSRVLNNQTSRTWIYLSDGTYQPVSSAARWKIGGMKWFTRIIGSNPSNCILDGAGAAYNLFNARGAGAKVWMENIHLRNTGGASATASEGAIVQLVNCDQTDCYFGLTGNSHSEIYMSGGNHKFTEGFVGYSIVRSMFLVKHSIGYKYDEDLGYAVADPKGSCPKFYGEGIGRGMLGQEHSTGHVRLDVIDNFSKGLELVSSSRAHLEDTLKVTRCGVGAEIENGCNIFDAGVDWTTRGPGKNSISIRYLGGVRLAEYPNQGSVRQRLGFKDLLSREISSTQEVMLGLDFQTDGISNNLGCTYSMRLTGSISGSAGRKTLRLLFNGSGYITSLVFPAAATGPFTLEFGFIKTAGDFVLPFGLGVASGLSASAGAAEGTSANAPVNRIIDTGSQGTLDVGVILESSGDLIVFNSATLHFEG